MSLSAVQPGYGKTADYGVGALILLGVVLATFGGTAIASIRPQPERVAGSFASRLAADYGTDSVAPVLPRLRPEILDEIATDEQALTGRNQEPLRVGLTVAARVGLPVTVQSNIAVGLSEPVAPADLAPAPAALELEPPALPELGPPTSVVATKAPPAQLPMEALRMLLRPFGHDETNGALRGTLANDNSGQGSVGGDHDHTGHAPGMNSAQRDLPDQASSRMSNGTDEGTSRAGPTTAR